MTTHGFKIGPPLVPGDLYLCDIETTWFTPDGHGHRMTTGQLLMYLCVDRHSWVFLTEDNKTGRPVEWKLGRASSISAWLKKYEG